MKKEREYEQKFYSLLKRVKLIQENLDSLELDQTHAYYASDALKKVVEEFEK